MVPVYCLFENNASVLPKDIQFLLLSFHSFKKELHADLTHAFSKLREKRWHEEWLEDRANITKPFYLNEERWHEECCLNE